VQKNAFKMQESLLRLAKIWVYGCMIKIKYARSLMISIIEPNGGNASTFGQSKM
jgi:hypothetical protein